MPRYLASLIFVLLAIAAIVGGRRLETSGLAEDGLEQAMQRLPGGDLPGEGTGPTDPGVAPPPTADVAPGDDRTVTPGPTPTVPEVVQADGPVDAPVGDAFYWGVHREQVAYDPDALDDLTGDFDGGPAIVMWYQEWAGSPPFPAEAAARVLERGAVPMITWEAWSPPAQDPSLEPDDARQRAEQPAFRLSRIADGRYDDYVRSYARAIAEFGGPVMLRPFHEMNGFWYPWGGTVNGNRPADFVAAWDHLHALFEAEGADNVTWVWSVNHRSLPDTTANSVDAYWPGAEQVDWIGVSGFNFGDTSSVSSWQSFEAIYGDVLAQLEEYERPVLLAEFATVPSGGDEAAWIADAFAQLQEEHEPVGGLVWFDREVPDMRDFRIDATAASGDAFRTAISDVSVIGAPAALRTATAQR